MRITIFDALPDPSIGRTARNTVAAAGHSVSLKRLVEQQFAPCRGCFECWVKHPGVCRASDGSNPLMAELVASDRILWITAPRFGAWDPLAKSALDKQIGILSPFFGLFDGETHHLKRYRRYPGMRVLALGERDREFEALVARNALNMHSDAPSVAWISPSACETAIRNATHALLDHRDPIRSVVPSFHHPVQAEAWDRRRKRAVLWIGSAKPAGRSSSESLGRALVEPLAEHDFEVEVVHLRNTVKLRRPSAALNETLADADLLVLATPVYIDSVPALVMRALCDLVDLEPPGRPAFVPIVQCGFPELAHNALALRTLERASRAAGLRWAGHLAVGGAGAIDGAPIAATGLLTPLHHALREASTALGLTGAIPEAATEAVAAPLMPARVYRWAGQAGWIAQAIKHGAATHLWDRPLIQVN